MMEGTLGEVLESIRIVVPPRSTLPWVTGLRRESTRGPFLRSWYVSQDPLMRDGNLSYSDLQCQDEFNDVGNL